MQIAYAYAKASYILGAVDAAKVENPNRPRRSIDWKEKSFIRAKFRDAVRATKSQDRKRGVGGQYQTFMDHLARNLSNAEWRIVTGGRYKPYAPSMRDDEAFGRNVDYGKAKGAYLLGANDAAKESDGYSSRELNFIRDKFHAAARTCERKSQDSVLDRHLTRNLSHDEYYLVTGEEHPSAPWYWVPPEY